MNLVSLYNSLSNYGLYILIFFSISYQVGWVHRVLWYIIESEACKILNGTPVTIGSYRIDILRGRIWIYNLVIHSPTNPKTTNSATSDSDETPARKPVKPSTVEELEMPSDQGLKYKWEWDAPLLARIGYVYVECNIVYCLFALWFLWEEAPLELYTIHLVDTQAFIERRNNLYNFFLCDPHVIIPSVPIAAASGTASTTTTTINNPPAKQGYPQSNQIYSNVGSANRSNCTDSDEDGTRASKTPLEDCVDSTEIQKTNHDGSPSLQLSFDNCAEEISDIACSQTVKGTTGTGNTIGDVVHDTNDLVPDTTSSPQRQRAQKVVDDMVSAVRHAANNGDWTRLLLQQRDVLTGQLRAWKDASSYQERSEVVSDGVKMIQQVSKSVIESSQTVRQAVLPPRRATLSSDKTVYARVGRVLIEDMRVFLHKQQPHAKNMDVDNLQCTSVAEDKEHSDGNPSGLLSQRWTKSIHIQRVSIRASEFCPQLSAMDTTYQSFETFAGANGKPIDNSMEDSVRIRNMPCLYQPIEKSIDVVIKRIVAEMAKSNTDLFLKAAMKEMADVFVTTTSTTGLTTTPPFTSATSTSNAFPPSSTTTSGNSAE